MITAKCATPNKNIVLEVSDNESFTKDVAQRRNDIERFTKSFTGDNKRELNRTE
ncbi:hypothetical protein [Streptomyces vilmorinianum]|uniref:hypothetical protein n=1 Tax=Streptomyces vilmorinianum TaxID=3051092 RepID=UPI00158628CB|nr:hypothetical protein [Streptomyces vilmorinianum]